MLCDICKFEPLADYGLFHPNNDTPYVSCILSTQPGAAVSGSASSNSWANHATNLPPLAFPPPPRNEVNSCYVLSCMEYVLKYGTSGELGRAADGICSCRCTNIMLLHGWRVPKNTPFQFQCLKEVTDLLSIKIAENLCTGFNSSSAPLAELPYLPKLQSNK